MQTFNGLFTKKIENRLIYLSRMEKPLKDKLKIVKYIPKNVANILDVGCADGSLTIALAKTFPDKIFLGVDLDDNFLDLAKEKAQGLKNIKFEKIYLRDLLARPERFDVVIFCSVLHEFFSYGEGISSVLKAIADAHELLRKSGVIIIRDMILSEYTKNANLKCLEVADKIYKAGLDITKEFEVRFGKLNNIYKINHYLLKYFYQENWNREGKENYVPVTIEQYGQIFSLLGMREQSESYLLDFFKDKWKKDFNLTADEISEFKSTGIIVAQK
ncbi:class I SAM-dependent methyltransferase [Candidatus Daviesbacteria bacterium]|nr:class I SAM-dependent methyltransferase [Candidatus Daviesbacteria bacterium]